MQYNIKFNIISLLATCVSPALKYRHIGQMDYSTDTVQLWWVVYHFSSTEMNNNSRRNTNTYIMLWFSKYPNDINTKWIYLYTKMNMFYIILMYIAVISWKTYTFSRKYETTISMSWRNSLTPWNIFLALVSLIVGN